MQRRFEVAGPVEIDIRLAAGEIDVDVTGKVSESASPESASSELASSGDAPGRDGSGVEVELIAHDDESRQLVESARVELQGSSGRPRLVVDVPQRRGGGFGLGFFLGRQGISCRVRAPRGSSLVARTKSADVAVHGPLGALNLATASGDVGVERVEGDLTVKSASGDIRALVVGGAVDVQTASGDVEIDVVRGVARVHSVSGDVTIGEADDSVTANTVSGDQRHGAVMRGNVTAHTVSGDVRIGVRRGSKVFLDCTTVSGETSSELDVSSQAPTGDGPLVEIRAKTVSGDITIARAPAAPLPAQTQEVHA